MGATVEMPMETGGRPTRSAGSSGLELRVLGPLKVFRSGSEIALPSSRKVRALLAYLALAPGAIGRSELCEMLWDVPNDPRGELRWCLSKIRAVVDDPDRQRLNAKRDTVALDLSDCTVDAAIVARAMERDHRAHALDEVRNLVGLFGGEVLEGFEVDRSPAFNTWLAAQRRRYRSCHAALLEALAHGAAGEEAFQAIEALVRIAPFDVQAHTMLLTALAGQRRFRDGDHHVETMAKLFEADGLDAAPLREAWRLAKARNESPRTATVTAAVIGSTGAEPPTARAARRASIAVMPFTESGGPTAEAGGLASALVHDVITRLAKLRSLFVIAQGTVFALHERGIGFQDSGRMLGVDYVVGGGLLRRAGRVVVQVELTETRTARVIWAETFEAPARDALAVLEGIGNRIVSSVVAEIEALERNRAVLKAPASLDAWEAYHRGLWHMYRFTKPDNDQARHLFEQAVRLDPTFSRAFAGLSFTYWQEAFQGWTAEPNKLLEMAYAKANESLLADDRDPAAHWAMGRALWIRGRHDQSVAELEQSVDLSPNFALAHYNLAFVHATTGDPSAAVAFSDQSRDLSPYDPMLFGMLGARAMALVRLGRYDEAADWGVKAAARPNSFSHIRGIAAFSLALADRMDEARGQLEEIRRAMPGYRYADFQRAFRIDANGVHLFRKGAKKLGVD